MKKLFLFLSIIFFSNAVYVDYAMNDTNGQSLQEKLATNSQQYFKQAKQEQTTKQQNNKKLQERVQKGMRTKERVQQAGMQMPG